ncbi:MAG: chemotaxis protein CheW [Gammaproteobacteria bacterium]
MHAHDTHPAPSTGGATHGADGRQAYTGGRFLTFLLGGETFALDILGIKEVIQYLPCTTVPMMPGFMHGVINLRGRVVPVIDLRARFGHGTSSIGHKTCIVVLEVGDGDGQQDVGVIVDAVQQVLQIPGGEIEPPPNFGARIRTEFIHGMGKVRDRFVIILDAEEVLSIEEMESLVRLGMDTTEEGARVHGS